MANIFCIVEISLGLEFLFLSQTKYITTVINFPLSPPHMILWHCNLNEKLQIYRKLLFTPKNKLFFRYNNLLIYSVYLFIPVRDWFSNCFLLTFFNFYVFQVHSEKRKHSVKEIAFLNTKREWLIWDLQTYLLMVLNKSYMQKAVWILWDHGTSNVVTGLQSCLANNHYSEKGNVHWCNHLE